MMRTEAYSAAYSMFPIGSEVGQTGYKIMECIKTTPNSYIYTVSSDSQKRVFKYVRPKAPWAVKQGERMANIKLQQCPHLLTGDVLDLRGSIGVLMPYCQANDLHDLVQRTKLEMNDVRSMSYQVLRGLKYMHANGMMHRDVKLENILVDDSHGLVAYLGDFGTAELLQESEFARVGTAGYQAPEIQSGGEYNEKVDMWSFGVVLYMMVAHKSPFKSDRDAREGNWDRDAVATRGEDFSDLLSNLFAPNPEERLSAIQAQKHPFYIDRSEISPGSVKSLGQSMISDALKKGDEASFDDLNMM